MQNYICKYGLYHDKPVKDGEPSSNNGWIYTAYAKALGFPLPINIDYDSLFMDCKTEESSNFIRNRLPKKEEPPVSRDEIIGMHVMANDVCFLLGNLYSWYLVKRVWEKYSIIQSIKALWKIRKKHRNYVWKNKVYPAYKLAFKLMPHDRYFIKSTSMHFRSNLYEWCMFQLYAFSTIVQRNISAKNILWLQLEMLNSIFWIRFINQPKNFKKYFPADHPFNR